MQTKTEEVSCKRTPIYQSILEDLKQQIKGVGFVKTTF